jgi:hypothetical protein
MNPKLDAHSRRNDAARTCGLVGGLIGITIGVAGGAVGLVGGLLEQTDLGVVGVYIGVLGGMGGMGVLVGIAMAAVGTQRTRDAERHRASSQTIETSRR